MSTEQAELLGFQGKRGVLLSDFHGIAAIDGKEAINPSRLTSKKGEDHIQSLIKEMSALKLFSLLHVVGSSNKFIKSARELSGNFETDFFQKYAHLRHQREYFDQFYIDPETRFAYQLAAGNKVAISIVSGTPSCCEDSIVSKIQEGDLWESLHKDFPVILTPAKLPERLYPGGAIPSPYVKEIAVSIAEKVLPSNVYIGYYDDTALGAYEVAKRHEIVCFVRPRMEEALYSLKRYKDDYEIPSSREMKGVVLFGQSPEHVFEYMTTGESRVLATWV